LLTSPSSGALTAVDVTGEITVLKGFKNFILRGDLVIIAVGLVIALAFSTLVTAFTTYVINPLIASVEGGHSLGLGVQLGSKGNSATFLNFGLFVSAIIYFIIFMAVVYFVIVVPYRSYQARQGNVVFGPPGPTRACPECLSTIPAAATRCMYCTAQVTPAAEAAS
jgi:large conductance mechanosensitive channel